MVIGDTQVKWERAKALKILQTSICKIRSLFSRIKDEIKLDYSGNRYCLLIEREACDYIQIEKALSHFKGNDKNTYSAVEKAHTLYGKGFLAEQGYLWSIAKDQELRECLIAVLNNYQSIKKNLREEYDTVPSERIERLIKDGK